MKAFIDEVKDIQHKQLEYDEANAAVLLNQMDIMSKQKDMDEVLAAMLLNGLEV